MCQTSSHRLLPTIQYFRPSTSKLCHFSHLSFPTKAIPSEQFFLLFYFKHGLRLPIEGKLTLPYSDSVHREPCRCPLAPKHLDHLCLAGTPKWCRPWYFHHRRFVLLYAEKTAGMTLHSIWRAVTKQHAGFDVLVAKIRPVRTSCSLVAWRRRWIVMYASGRPATPHIRNGKKMFEQRKRYGVNMT